MSEQRRSADSAEVPSPCAYTGYVAQGDENVLVRIWGFGRPDTSVKDVRLLYSFPPPPIAGAPNARAISDAYSDWAWEKEGTPVGLMLPNESARTGFFAGAKWASSVQAALTRTEPQSSSMASDDPTASKEWNDGCDFAMTQLCKFLDVEPSSVSWDAATETVEGDVSAVIGNILRAKFGEDWGPQCQAVSVDLGRLIDWVYLYATEGGGWPDTKTVKDPLIALATKRKPTQEDADRLKAHGTLKQLLALTRPQRATPSAPDVSTPVPGRPG